MSVFITAKEEVDSTMKVRARYRPKGVNPFADHLPPTVKIEVDFPDDTTVEQLEKDAKKATPKGHEFIEVLILES